MDLGPDRASASTPADPIASPTLHPPRIVAVATATPPRRFTQSEVLAVFGYQDTQRRHFFEHSEIESRYMYVDASGHAPTRMLTR
jgi:hypothetical protein